MTNHCVPIADCAFLPRTKAAFLGQENSGVHPESFEWQLEDPKHARFVTDGFIKEAKGPGQIAMLLEPYFLHPENYTQAMSMNFDHVLTHNRWFADNLGWLWYPAGGSYISFDKWGLREKTKDVSMIVSPKNTMPGHKLRHMIAEKYGDRIDVLGLDHPVAKWEGLADYRYSIVIENEKTDGWFTEKLIDALSVGTIPIYWGCPDFQRYFSYGGFIVADDIENVESAICAVFGSGDTSQYYDLFSTGTQNNFEAAKDYRICEDWIYKKYPFLFK